MTLRNVIPIILSALLIGLICILLLIRVKNQSIWDGYLVNFDVVFVLTYLLWISLEIKVSKAEISKGNKTSDYGTCELYAMGQAAVILSALWQPSAFDVPNIFHFLGFIPDLS